MIKRIILFLAGCLLVPLSLVVDPGLAVASEADCTGTEQNPIYPNKTSGHVADNFTNKNRPDYGDIHIPIRDGFYCVPAIAANDDFEEWDKGIGFGLEKVQDRHHIGRAPDWTQEEAILAIKAVLNSTDVKDKTDGWGRGFNMHTWTNAEEGCTYDNPSLSCTNNAEYIHVIAAVTVDGEAFDPQGGMPAGVPLGLQTVYCDLRSDGEEDPEDLRCPAAVTGNLEYFGFEMDL